MAKFIDLTGKKIHDWQVVCRVANRVYKSRTGGKDTVSSAWKCMCVCGNERTLCGYMLQKDRSKGCGCKRLQRMSIRLSKEDTAFRQTIAMYKQNAKKKGREFLLTEEQCSVLFRSECAYCGMRDSNTTTTRKGDTYTYNGIDRVDSNLGYVWDNCQSCCCMCNRMKSDFTHAEFVARCVAIARRRIVTSR